MLTALPVSAHNGAVAIAVPVEGIVVDGDLSDWPKGLRPYPVAVYGFGPAPADESDLSASFRIGYSQADSILYLAVVVRDDVTSQQDDCLVLLDDPEEPHGSPAAVLEAESAARGTGRLYEFSIGVAGTLGGTLGLDILIVDVDAGDDGTEISWGTAPRYSSKYFADARRQEGPLGDVVLSPAGSLGRIQGEARWTTHEPAARVQVTVRSQTDSSLWVRTMTDRSGNFATEMPTGRYIASALGTRAEIDNVAGSAARARLEGRARGRSVPAAGSRGVVAGPGRQMGQWQTFGYADGLPPFTTNALTQDADGALWIGYSGWWNGNGVVRYDGTRLQSHTAPEWLAGRDVAAIAIGRDGSVWVACVGGISRYDGDTWTTYTAHDGLVDDRVHDVLVAEDGKVWSATCGGVSRFDGESFTNYTAEDGLTGGDVVALAQGPGAEVWAATATGYLYFLDGSSWQEASYPQAMRWMNAMQFDPDGRLWLWGSGVSICTADSCAWFLPEDTNVNSVLLDTDEEVWITARSPGGVTRYAGASTTTYGPDDGVASNQSRVSLVDGDGDLWFGSYAAGLSRYRKRIMTYTSANGLLHDLVFAVMEDTKGHIWAATGLGVSRFDGSEWTKWGGDDAAMLGAGCIELFEASNGDIWVATKSGVARFDGHRWQSFTEEDGLAARSVHRMAEDEQGRIWLTSLWGAGPDAVSRFDGSQWTTHRMDYNPGLVWADPDGSLWFAGVARVSRLRKDTWTHWGAADGLGSMLIYSLISEPDGTLLAATFGDGLVGFDGSRWAAHETTDGLNHDVLCSVMRDSRGYLWVGTSGGGVNVHDGNIWQRILEPDGLGNDVIQEIIEARNGDMWIATEAGLTRYRPGRQPPVAHIIGIATDRALPEMNEVRLPSTQDYLLVEFEGASLRTPIDRLVYAYRLQGMHDEWRYTRERRLEYTDLPMGEYVFQVQAVDQDLNYSEPTSVRIVVHPAYGQLALWTSLVLSLAGLGVASTYGLRRRRDQRRAEQTLMREMEEELQDARRLQLSLMPTASPDVPGMHVSGRCVSANHVGGDFFQYSESDDGITISLADVTGHAMEAAIPAVMFSGVLDTRMEAPKPLQELFDDLNRSLCRSLQEHTYVCLSMVEIKPVARTVRIANCGCPYPLHYHAATGDVSEWRIDAYPLGVRQDTVYTAKEGTLAPGDCLVLYSDGFPEAANVDGDMFGFDRAADVIRQGCSEGLSPEKLIDRLIHEVTAFTGDEPQADDMTCVVVRVEE